MPQIQSLQRFAATTWRNGRLGIDPAMRGRGVEPMDTQGTPVPSSNSPAHRFEPRIGRSVSLDQAAQLLGVSRRTIYNRIREGRLQTIRTLGGSQRVLLNSVQRVHLHGSSGES
jgi:excisionase family DNA binding protein